MTQKRNLDLDKIIRCSLAITLSLCFRPKAVIILNWCKTSEDLTAQVNG